MSTVQVEDPEVKVTIILNGEEAEQLTAILGGLGGTSLMTLYRQLNEYFPCSQREWILSSPKTPKLELK